jgi:hypothetical protein
LEELKIKARTREKEDAHTKKMKEKEGRDFILIK